MAVKPIPDGYHTVTPYLVVADTQAQLEFIVNALGGTEVSAMRLPDGTPMHAETQLGDSKVMLGMSAPEFPPLPAMLYVYVADVDRAYQQAVGAGGESLQEPQDQFYGDRTAAVKDPNGNKWYLATHVEDVSEEEMEQRGAKAMQQAG
jgi:uncharacterized glyoxalase superfamily protein PhnB